MTSPGLVWRLLRRQSGAAGDVAVWTTRVPALHPTVRVTSQLRRGTQSVTVIAMESTKGIDAVVGTARRGVTAASLTTTKPVSLLFAVGVQTGLLPHAVAGWATLFAHSRATSAVSSWVRYTTQPFLTAGTRVVLSPSLGSGASSTTIVVELPGDNR